MSATKETATVEQWKFKDDGAIPNNPSLPLLVYRGVLELGGDPAGACEARFAKHGWGDGWRNGVYPYHHYHSKAHEALGVVRGEARVRFGGERGETVTVRAGDVVVIPAGVAHKNEGASDDLLIIGAYPDKERPDICRGNEDERKEAIENIRRVKLPERDPVFGADGPLVWEWRGG